MLLLTLYVAAAGANSLGILRCDCAAHHSHDICCGHNHHDHDHDSDHDSDCCGPHGSAFCRTEGFSSSLTEHCSCTHRHGDSEVYTVTSDPDELLKYIKPFVGDALCAADGYISIPDDARIATVFRACDTVPIAMPPVLVSGAPRAPSFSA